MEEQLAASFPGPWWVAAAMVFVSLLAAGRWFGDALDASGATSVLFLVLSIVALVAAVGFGYVARAKWRWR